VDKIKNIFVFAIIGLFVLMIFNSCHKYPEDTFLSLRNPKVRLCGRPKDGGKRWWFTSYKINGIDHNHDFDNFIKVPRLTEGVAIFFFSNGGTDSFIINNTSTDAKGHFDLRDNNATIIISCSFSSFQDPFSAKFLTQVLKVDTLSEAAAWTIEELYNNNLHIRNNNVDIYFKSK
jgi:hypothetical protein